MWYLIALSKNVDRAAWWLEDRTKKLTPDQVTEAERLAAEWQRSPTPCEQEVEIAAAGG